MSAFRSNPCHVIPSEVEGSTFEQDRHQSVQHAQCGPHGGSKSTAGTGKQSALLSFARGRGRPHAFPHSLPDGEAGRVAGEVYEAGRGAVLESRRPWTDAFSARLVRGPHRVPGQRKLRAYFGARWLAEVGHPFRVVALPIKRRYAADVSG